MENIYKLKTQLEEAVRFANSSVLGHDRISVILMDNFVELQLGRQMFFKFRSEFLNNYKNLKYPLDKRQEIRFKYDKLLKACHQEGMISAHERNILAFCHDIRNRLYHRGDDDSLLIKIALHALHDIIVIHQPKWCGGTDIIRVTIDADFEHPFSKKRRMEAGDKAYQIGSREDWHDFVKHKFDILNEDQSPSALLAQFLRDGIERLKSAMNYALPDGKTNGFDDLLLRYSFKIKCRDELQRIREIQDKRQAGILHKKLFKQYRQSYKALPLARMKSFEDMVEKLPGLSSGDALEKYLSIRTDYLLVHDSLVLAAQAKFNDLSNMVDRHIKNISRSKKRVKKS
ncbi:MAG TPA: hypothetical protein VG737_16965 [Cyclobacteriaceae bacterium]|nr:hypothetical protein [Cyclobacteriaceae bacterium]